MRCEKCGFDNIEEAIYCGKCGSKLADNAGQQMMETAKRLNSGNGGNHPYHKLGGWLGFITYGLLIAVIIIVLGAVIGSLALFRIAKYYGFKIVLLALIEIAVYIPVVYYCLKMYTMIKNKNTSFLRFYEITMLIMCGISVILMIIGKMSGLVSIKEQFGSLIQSVIIFVIWLTYFRKSVRVRTYFGSDDYLKKSIFLKNCQAPDPVD